MGSDGNGSNSNSKVRYLFSEVIFCDFVLNKKIEAALLKQPLFIEPGGWFQFYFLNNLPRTDFELDVYR
jgi:hypothetical protein